MAGLNRYKEIAMRFHMIGMRKINEGDVIRTVAISERDAKIMNELEESRDELQGGCRYQYVLIEEGPLKKEKSEVNPDDKAIRAEYFAKAVEHGLNLPKNIKTENLIAKVNEVSK